MNTTQNQGPAPEEQIETDPSFDAAMNNARDYFLALAQRSKELSDEVESAKTNAKKKYFRKKLKQNNALAVRALTLIDRLDKRSQES